MQKVRKIQRLQVFEHQTIRIGDVVNGLAFPKILWDNLAVYHEKHKGKYYQLLYNGVKFKQYVGVLQIGKWTIEILPKIDSTAETDAPKWQAVLLDMLAYCQYIKVDTAGYGQVQLTHNPILNIYFDLFLKEVKRLLQEGIPKQYAQQEANKSFLKGQLVLPKHLRLNLHHPERFYIRYQNLQEHRVFTTIIYDALKSLRQLHLPARQQLVITQLMITFPTPTSDQWHLRDFEQLLSNPVYRSFTKLLELARLILMNFSSDIRYGQHQLLAILFDMNVLFEEYIFQQLKNTKGIATKISRQRSIPFWQRRSIRPDIVLEMNGEKIVMDTKWKVLPTTSPSMEDLKQMYIYCRYFKAKKGILLFPSAEDNKQAISDPFLDEADGISCQLQFINVLDKQGKLRKDIGIEMLRS